MKHQGKSKEKKNKSRKGKRKSAEMEPAIDQERESARALLQMRGVPIDDTQTLYDGDDVAASQQLIGESSPRRPAEQSTVIEDAASQGTSKRKGGDKKNKKTKKKGGRGDHSAGPRNEESNHGEAHQPHLPSTPRRQTSHATPPPHRPSLSHSNHALDEIPTDDEDVTQYMQEFATEGGEANPQALSDNDIYGFSQQPPDASDHSITQSTMHSISQLPTGQPRKRTRHTASTGEQLSDEQQSLANGEGQHSLDFSFDFEAFDDLFKDAMNSANPFTVDEANNMPIDPQLHSMSQLPPSVDLSQLDNEGDNGSQKRKKKEDSDVASQPKKRRRVEELQDTNSSNGTYYSPYTFDRGQENMQDQVLPGFEDLQRQTSPELGSPFIEDLAHKGLEYLNDKARSKSARRKKKSDAAGAPAIQPSSKKGKEIEPTRPESSGKGGPFTDAEASKLDTFRNAFCNANDLTTGQFNSRVQSTMRGNTDVIALFNEIQDLFPYRPRMSVQKFCRRRYHNFPARGTWTSEDDEMLRQAVAEKGKQWKAVGEMIDRMGEDCRDRYRNYILNSENRNHEQWTPEEVRSLCTAILDSVEAMKDERKQERRDRYGENGAASDSDSNMEGEDMKAINWQAISDRMGGQRSRLQCSGKWRQLEKQEKNDVAQSILDQRGLQGRRLQPTKNPWRMKNATKKVANMKPGDMHALVQAILDCGVPVEGNIPWKALGDDDLRATWNSTAKKAAWSKLKQDIPDSQSMDYRDVASHLLTKIEDEGAGDLEERWNPELHGDVSARKPRKSNKSRGKEAESTEISLGRRKMREKARKDYKESELKSNEFVQDSDDDHGVPSTYEPQHHKRFGPLPRSDDAIVDPSANGDAALNVRDDQREAATIGIVEDEDSGGSLFNGSMNGDDEDDGGPLFNGEMNDDDDEAMVDGDVSPTLARRMQLLKDA